VSHFTQILGSAERAVEAIKEPLGVVERVSDTVSVDADVESSKARLSSPESAQLRDPRVMDLLETEAAPAPAEPIAEPHRMSFVLPVVPRAL
jgi:hypothetical protein